MTLKISLPLVTTVGLACLTYPVSAQVVPDNSLGNESSIVTPNVTLKDAVTDFIEGGAIRGNNLFHSFEQFNVGEGANVYFANPNGVVNILNRVTGNNASNIFGTLGVDGSANLFLLNPNGIVFGENAALDVSGSFVATTADSYIFDNGFKYSASNLDAPPLLTIDLPVGVQLGNNPGSITVQGIGHNLALDPYTFVPIRDNRPVGLEVESGNTLMLLGGEINLAGGNLTAPKGNVELGGAGATETIGLNFSNNGLTFDYGEVSNFADINLTDAASIEVSGSGGGSIRIQGKNISVTENSVIIANTFGTDNAGNVDLIASESVKIISTEGEFPSYILAQIEVGATGDGGNLTIDTKELEVSSSSIISTSTLGTGNGGNLTVNSDRIIIEDGGKISTGTYDAGNGGDLSVSAESIEIKGTSPLGNSSGLFSTAISPKATVLGNSNGLSNTVSPETTGNGGNLTVNSDRIILQDGGQITSGTYTAGNSGDLTVNAKLLEIRGSVTPKDAYTGLFSTVVLPEATGNGGNLTVNSDRIILENGGQINAGTLGAGDSGDLSVNAESIEIREVSSSGNSSGLFSTAILPETTGDGGNLTVNSDRIILENGGQIASGTSGTGNSGDLTVNAESIEISGVTRGETSGLYSTVITPEATGDGGNLTVNSDRIILENGGLIASGTLGAGNSGDLNVNTESIEIRGTTPLGDPSGLLSTVASPLATGNGGNIAVNSDRIILENGGLIASGTFGAGNSGDLSIKASDSITINGINSFTDLEGKDKTFASGLFASVEAIGTGDGGNLTIATPQLHIFNGGQITVSTLGQGNAGSINIQANNIDLSGFTENRSVSDIQPELFPSNISAFSSSEFAAGSITIESNNLNLSDRGNISVSNSGTGNSGNLNITANELNLDRAATIEARVNAGDRGNINLTTDKIALNDRSQITVQATGTATGGNITIDNSNLILARNDSDIIANAVFGSGGNISILSELVLTDLTSNIDASSEFGLDGVVSIKSPDSQKELSEVVLPTKIENLTNLITVTCSANDNNAVAIIGNGGIPNSPYQTQSLDATWHDLRPVKQETTPVAASPKSLTEANSTVINPDGELELVALTALSTHRWINSSCSN